jgi:hypothetical protein
MCPPHITPTNTRSNTTVLAVLTAKLLGARSLLAFVPDIIEAQGQSSRNQSVVAYLQINDNKPNCAILYILSHGMTLMKKLTHQRAP